MQKSGACFEVMATERQPVVTPMLSIVNVMMRQMISKCHGAPFRIKLQTVILLKLLYNLRRLR